MAYRKAGRLAKMNAASRRGTISIRSHYTSIQELLNERTEDYPTQTHLEAYNYKNIFHKLSKIKKYQKLYSIPDYIEIGHPGDSVRTCHWDPHVLCIYLETLYAGTRLPFHDFIIKLLADVRIHPCQISPNGWRCINVFIALCTEKQLPITVALFRKIFQFKKSPSCGFVLINQRPNMPHIFNGLSLPSSKPKWKEQFLTLTWRDGDWGTLFRKSFSPVRDGHPDDIELTEEETIALFELQKDNGSTHYRKILDEFNFKKLKLSRVSDKGNYYLLLFLLDC